MTRSRMSREVFDKSIMEDISSGAFLGCNGVEYLRGDDAFARSLLPSSATFWPGWLP